MTPPSHEYDNHIHTIIVDNRIHTVNRLGGDIPILALSRQPQLGRRRLRCSVLREVGSGQR